MPQKDPIKAYDARWEMDEFSDDAVRRLFEAALTYGRDLGADTVTLARDGRLGAAHVMELAAEAATRMGFRLFVCPDPISTPQSYFATLSVSGEHPSTMGLMITASHNPQQYVGVKFTVPVVRAIGLDCGPLGGLTRIRQLYHSSQKFPGRSGGRRHKLDVGREYADFSMAQAGIGPQDLSGLSVVLDAFNGSAGPELLAALERAGVRVEPLRLIPDGRFPNGLPNPTSRGKMACAVELAGRRDCSVVIGVDGDGDRIVFGDRRGILNAGFAAIPVLRACGRDNQSGQSRLVLYDPKVNPPALLEWRKLDIQPVLFRNGHSQIKDHMQRVGALAAAEESGHYYHRITMGDLTVSCENSLMTILLFLGAFKNQPTLLDDLWRLQEQVATTGEFNYRFDGNEIRDRALGAVVDCLADDGAAVVTHSSDRIDLEGTLLSKGVVLNDDAVTLTPGWYRGYLRVATTENGVLRSYFSADKEQDATRLEKQTRHILENQFGGTAVD